MKLTPEFIWWNACSMYFFRPNQRSRSNIGLIHFIYDTNLIHGAHFFMHHFQVKRSNVKVTWVIQDFCLVCVCWGLLHSSMPIWPIGLICCTNMTHEVTIFHTPFLGQQVKCQGRTGCSMSCYVASVPPCLFDTNITHEVVMCQAPLFLF